MIILYHRNSKVTRVFDAVSGDNIVFSAANPTKMLFENAAKNRESLIIWCEESLADSVNFEALSDIFHHKRIFASFNPAASNYLPPAAGYVEDSMFLNVNKKVSYATWQMSGAIGGIHASILNLIGNQLSKDDSFDYFVNSLAKLAMPLGLFCYSEPRLLK